METHHIQYLTDKKAKMDSAVNGFQAHFTSHLQTLMKEAGFSQSDLNVNSQTYLEFKNMILIYSYMKLEEYKKGMSEEEQNYWDWLEDESNIDWKDPKMKTALISFENSIPEYLQKTMIDAGFEASDTEQNSASYLLFFSNALNAETEKLMSYKSSPSDENRKKQRIDTCSQETSASIVEIKATISSIKLLKSTKRHNIYCISTPDGTRALKTTVTDNPSMDDVQNLDNELKIGSQTSNLTLRKSYAKTIHQNKKALLLEWVDGYPLSDIEKLAIPNFLKVAREIVSCLLVMHANKICHLNLSCDHVILNYESESIKIIGCGSSSSFCNKRNHNPKLTGKDLHYISPEQTGRANRDVDFRSDFYSLGIIFYRLLVGKHPFDGENASKIIKMHLFQDPLPLHVIEPNIPLPLSNMVSKLIEKDADLRYKSAKGIMHDIDLIISDYKPGIEIVLAQHDTPGTILLPQKLYGRTDEYNKLVSAYDRTASSSSFELALVAGNSGTGKTALVKELNKHVVKNGIFICGKYDSSKSEPFSAFIEAVNMFCDVIELEDEAILAQYRSKIQDAVGEEGKLLTNVVNGLRSIIGKQPETFETFGAEAKNRFNYVFVKFIKAIASVSCPLVVVLEDLQWIDSASLDLLKALVEGSVKHLVIIGNYRDNEMEDGHNLVNFIETVRKMNVSLTEITINNMDHECINGFLADALDVSPVDAYSLTAFIHDKAEGNLLFVKQMIIDLLEKESITYNYGKRKWTWDLSIFEGANISKSVLDLLKQKIISMNEYTKEALKYASCLGGTFSLSSLRIIVQNEAGVEDALATGMIIQCKGSDTGCFAHDQVKHAAKSLLPKDPKPVYLHVARKLCKYLSTEGLMENIYTIANLLDQTKDTANLNERPNITKLFFLAGDKAMQSAAPVEAFKYFKSGIKLLDKNDWKTRYEFSIKIHLNAAKMAYWLTNYKYMNKYIEQIFKNTKSPLDLVTPYLLLIRMCNDKLMFNGALGNASIILNKLGENINLNQSTTTSEILQTKNLVGKPIENVLEMREMTNITALSVMEIINTIAFSSFKSGNRHLYSFLTVRMVQLTMQHGISKYACIAFCAFAMVLRGIGDKASYAFGELSLKLLEKIRSKEAIPRVNMGFFNFISPFYRHLRKSLIPIMSAAIVSIETGLHHMTLSIVDCYCSLSFFCGNPLSKLLDELVEFEKVLVVRSKLDLVVHQAILNLLDSNIKNPAKLSGEKFDYKRCFDKVGVKFDIARASVISSTIAYLFYDYDTALQLIEICKPLIKCLDSLYLQSIFYFYDGLIASALAKNTTRKEILIQTIEENIAILKKFAEDSPENYLGKVHLLEAELAVTCKKHSEAKLHYQTAISLSNKHGFVNDEAMACERYAIFSLEIESQSNAELLLVQCHNCYKAWEAESKMLHLIQKYNFLAGALKATPSIDKSDRSLQVNDDANESVSVLTDSSSNLWQEQKLSRLSISK